MSDANVIRQTRVGYGKQGQDVLSDEAFMQFQISFMKDGALHALKGAPLSAFIAVGLHEAEVLLGIAEPFTLQDLIDVTDYSRPVMVRALDYLVDTRFVEELPERGARKEKQYRIAAYMWFGTGRRGTSRAKTPSPKTKSKDSLLSPSKSKQFTDSPHDDDVIKHDPDFDKNIIIHDWQKAREIFSAVGMQGAWLEDVARKPAPLERAHVWADWITAAKEVPDQYRQPFGYVHKVYLADPMAEPPAIQTRSKGWISDEYKPFVHGTPEHDEYRKIHGCDVCDRAERMGDGDGEMAADCGPDND